MKNPEINLSEQNRGEQIASKMFDISDRAERPKDQEILAGAAREFGNENYDKGQRILEEHNSWQDNIRGVVVEANSVEQEKRGIIPLSFGEAKGTINRWGEQLIDSGDKINRKIGLEIGDIALGADRPGTEGLDDALKYVEGTLFTRVSENPKINPEIKKDLEEKRAVRDALFLEKQRRIERLEEQRQANHRPVINEAEKKRIQEQDERELARLRGELGLDEKKGEKLSAEDVRNKFGIPELEFGDRGYGPRIGAASTFEVLKQLNPDAEQLFGKIEKLKAEFQATIERAKKSNPGKSEDAYKRFADNQIFEQLKPDEKQALEQFMVVNSKKMGWHEFHISAGQQFGDFIGFITK